MPQVTGKADWILLPSIKKPHRRKQSVKENLSHFSKPGSEPGEHTGLVFLAFDTVESILYKTVYILWELGCYLESLENCHVEFILKIYILVYSLKNLE